MKKLHILILTLLLSITFSCNREWKKTSEATFNIELIKTNVSSSYIEITTGYFIVSEFYFDGTRTQADHVIFNDHFENIPKEIKIAENTTFLSIYDIPQGSFSVINTKLKFESTDNNNSIEINGFINESSKSAKIPFQLFIKKQLESDITTLQPTEIIAEINTTATIKINVMDWFTLVPLSIFQQAERKTVNGVSTISISEDFNENIYTLILEKIGKNDELILN